MLKWFGPEVIRTVNKTAEDSINEVMGKAVRHAKANHPGWKSVSGKAQDSIRIINKARVEGGNLVGRWGSMDVPYMLVLEFKHGRALIRAADATYKELPKTIRKRLRFAKAKRRR
jgi:predicted small metal-binding protein